MCKAAKMKFVRAGKRLTIPEICGEITQTVKRYPSHRHYLIVGTDSHYRGRKTTVAVVIFYQVGKKIRKYWHSEKRIKRGFELSDKIAMEVDHTRDIIDYFNGTLINELIDIILPEIDNGGDLLFEVHLDVNRKGGTRSLVDASIKKFSLKGVKVVIKPESLVATRLADRYSKKAPAALKVARRYLKKAA